MHTQKIPDDFIETVRRRTDIMDVVSKHLALKKSGRNFIGLCPFHSEKTPSFTVNPEKQFFHCFGCSAGGDVFHFLSKIEQITFLEAVTRLAEAAGLKLPASRSLPAGHSQTEILYRIHEEAARFFHESLLRHNEALPARRYLEQRGISSETIQKFSLGFAVPYREYLIKRLGISLTLLEKAGLVRRGEKGIYEIFRHRIMLPIKTVEGRVIAFGGRVMDQREPKYLNTPETPIFSKGKHLYGLDVARGKTELILVEGYFDALSLYQQGITHAVATLGTAITPDHLHIIRRYVEKVYLVFDSDAAGQSALFRSAPLFLERGIAAEVITMPSSKDPDLFIRQEGKAAFLEQVQQAQPLLDFVVAHAVRRAEASGDRKTKVLHELFGLIQKIPSHVEQGEAFKKIAESWGMHEKDVRADYQSSLKGRVQHPLRLGKPVAENRFPSNRLPQEEEILLALMVQERLRPDELSGLCPDDFTALSLLVATYWNATEQLWGPPHHRLEALSESEKNLVTRLAVLDIPDEYQEKMKQDCIRRLQQKRLERKIRVLDETVKKAEHQTGPMEANALHRLMDLKRELQKVS